MKNRLTLTMIGAVMCAGPRVAPAQAQHDHGAHDHGAATKVAPLPNCPVMDEPVNLGISVATDEGPVYFCCSGCIAKYEKNPERYADKVAVQRQALAKRPSVQVTCPVTRKPVDGKTSIEMDGKTVQFCSEDCAGKYRSDPSKYAAALRNSFSYQTTCPVMGEPIKPTVFTKLPTGETIYYCCKACDKSLRKNPLKYNQSLLDQGIVINWGAVKEAETDGGTDHDDHEHHHDDGHNH